jgi:hypothetical protein
MKPTDPPAERHPPVSPTECTKGLSPRGRESHVAGQHQLKLNPGRTDLAGTYRRAHISTRNPFLAARRRAWAIGRRAYDRFAPVVSFIPLREVSSKYSL